MRAAGIRWARTDFDWTTVQHQAGGPWDYTMFDETLRKAEAAGITILPILAYDVAWARPAYQHLDLWREYVRNMVSRYKGRLTYWEVWNEPDLEQFWKEKPDPANYTTLLKAAYEEIKAIDPEAKVLLGGLSGIPFEFRGDLQSRRQGVLRYHECAPVSLSENTGGGIVKGRSGEASAVNG